ncbi:MAG: cupin domain-containing protein [Alphaproteobacteria bacterium]|nr:cupin domain-containing protein [Alphaproteobacteria bacterium]
MTAVTPKASNHDGLGPLASRYVDVGEIPWEPTPYAGIEWKILLKDEESGLLTALFKWEPGSELPLHEHTDIEQTFVIEGSIEDEEGEVTAGNFVWRPTGSRHVARSRNGAVLLGTFLRPNRFFSTVDAAE